MFSWMGHFPIIGLRAGGREKDRECRRAKVLDITEEGWYSFHDKFQHCLLVSQIFPWSIPCACCPLNTAGGQMLSILEKGQLSNSQDFFFSQLKLLPAWSQLRSRFVQMSIKDRGNILKEVWRLSGQAPTGTNESCLLNPPHAAFATQPFCIEYPLATGFIPSVAQALERLQCVVRWGLLEILVLFQSIARCVALWRLKEKGKSSACTEINWSDVVWWEKRKGISLLSTPYLSKIRRGFFTACDANRSVRFGYAGPCLNGGFYVQEKYRWC